MAKKLTLFLTAAAFIALTVPAFANAAALTDGSGNLLPVGTVIIGTSTNATTQTSLGSLTCEETEIEDEVLTNNAFTITLGRKGPKKPKNCKLGKKTIEISQIGWHVHIGETFTAEVTFVAELPELTCHFEGTIPITYTSGGNSFKVTNGDLTGTPEACEPGTFNGTFTLTQSGGGAVVLD